MARTNNAITGRFEFAFADPIDLAQKCQEYFDSLTDEIIHQLKRANGDVESWTETTVQMPGIAGLANHLDIDRHTFLYMCQRAEGDDQAQNSIRHVITRAKRAIEAAQERGLFDKENHKGSAFSLLVNYGWTGEVAQPGGEGGLTINTIAPGRPEDVRAIAKWEDD